MSAWRWNSARRSMRGRRSGGEMTPFTDEIVERLNSLCGKDRLRWVHLGEANFDFSFEGIENFGCFTTVKFFIGGSSFVWDDGPIDAPIWLLVGQTPEKFELLDELTLRLSLTSGDHLDISTDRSPYEAVVVHFEQPANSMEIF